MRFSYFSQMRLSKSATVLFVSAIFIFAGSSSTVFAQATIDPSSALLLNGGASNESRTRTAEPRLDSGRYIIRPRLQPATEKIPSEKTPAPRKTPSEPTVSVPAAVVPTTAPAVILAPTSAPVVLVPNEEGTVVLDEAPVIPALPHRLIDVSVGTAYVYQASDSSYSYRSSTIAAPAYALGAKVWLSSQFAIGARYLSTFGGHVQASGASDVAASLTEAAYGIYLRRAFANSNLTFGIEFQDSNLGLASEATTKVKTKSSGIRFGLEGEFQSGESSSWAIGFAASPKLQHEELAAATQVQSGAEVNAYSLEASIERRWKFDSANALFIRLEHKVERDLFTGPASGADPIGGATPNGVAVTAGKTLIQFGYNWGN